MRKGTKILLVLQGKCSVTLANFQRFFYLALMRRLLTYIWLFLIFSFLQICTVSATVFWVTSNADSGPQSFRQAIIDAAANPPGQRDYIYFNIPGTQTSDLSISLLTELPRLSSDLVIDATTQGANVFNSLNNAKIRLYNGSGTYIHGLSLVNINQVEIYGLFFENFDISPNAGINELKGAIYLQNASNITIGAPQKGNAFGANYAGVYAPFDPQHELSAILIQSNFFGLKPDGEGQLANKNGLDLSYLKNSIIGGKNQDQGNLFGSNLDRAINAGGMMESVLIAHNRIGLDIQNRLIANNNGIGIYANGISCILTIEDNRVGGQARGIQLNEVNKVNDPAKAFIIQRNQIGTQGFGNTISGVEINNSGKGFVGNSNVADANDISYNADGIVILNSYPVTITKNSIYCNTRFPIRHQNVDISKITAPAINSIAANRIVGLASSNAIIEVFGNHACSGCQGKDYLGSVKAASDGTFTYSGPMANSVTITATHEEGATSAFTSPVLNDLAKQITDEQCGNLNGSIRNITVAGANSYRWFNANNVLVASTADLLNVKAGTYYLVAGQPGGCEVISPSYEIKSISVDYKVKVANLVSSACGKVNGMVNVISFETATPTQFSWVNENDVEVSKERNLVNAPPGVYKLYGDNGSGCKSLAGTFVIAATTDLVLNTQKMNILNTDCSKDEGSISNLAITGGTGPYRFEWMDAQGNVVGNEADLIQVASGTYHLLVTDAKGCTVQSDEFIIPPSPFNSKLPDSFSPNGDGINDVWRIPGLAGLSDYEIKIFNRQGNTVFYTKNKPKDFDGRLNNVDLPVGVYYYVIELKNNNCKRLHGSIMLIR